MGKPLLRPGSRIGVVDRVGGISYPSVITIETLRDYLWFGELEAMEGTPEAYGLAAVPEVPSHSGTLKCPLRMLQQDRPS